MAPSVRVLPSGAQSARHASPRLRVRPLAVHAALALALAVPSLAGASASATAARTPAGTHALASNHPLEVCSGVPGPC